MNNIYISFSSVKECKLIKESKSAFGTQAVIITLSNHFSGPERIAIVKLRAIVAPTSTST